jgi:hypothetical protein
LKSLLKPEKKKPEYYYWPSDLLAKDFENVRILTRGYDSHVAGSPTDPANQCGISDFGESLLNDLEVQRRGDPTRPLIWITHSLGGLVVKEVSHPHQCLAVLLII